jgi:hypothetical protein
MDDEIETLMIDVRASTAGLRADLEVMRGTLLGTLDTTAAEAGAVLERGLLSAIRRGSVGFDDLKRVALATMDEIAAGALARGIGSVTGAPATGGGNPLAGLLAGAAGALLGLPGRATGGPVAPGRPYWVGERGPELFVPTAAGRVEPAAGGQPREVRVSIQLHQPRGGEAPTALRRSQRQIASHIRRSLRAF